MKWLYACTFLVLTSCSDLDKLKGPAGPQGPKGDTGSPGQNCTVQEALNGAVILCPDGTNVLVLNGTNGVDGLPAPAPSSYTISEIIDPCGRQGAFDEVLLRLTNGQLIAHYSGHGDNFLTLISPGNYITTDGTRCNFNVTNSLGVTWN